MWSEVARKRELGREVGMKGREGKVGEGGGEGGKEGGRGREGGWEECREEGRGREGGR